MSFPPGWSLGTLYVRDSGDLAAEWDEFGDARGAVVVPMGKALRLVVCVEDLSPLAALQPGDVQDLDLLSGAQVTDAGLAYLRGLTGLGSVSLDGTLVTDAGLTHLRGLTALTCLSLVGARVSDVGLAHLWGLTALTSLWLGWTQVSDAGLAHLRGLTALTCLHLVGTRVSDAGLAHLRGLTALEWLDVSGTGIGDAGLAHLRGLTALTRLWLGRTQVSDAGLVHLRGLVGLRSLYLEGTWVTDGAVRSLALALPQCKILLTTEGESPVSPRSPADALVPAGSEDVAGGKYLEVLRARWPKVLAALHRVDLEVEAVLRSCEPIDVSDGTVTVGTPFEWHQGKLEESASRAVAQQVISQVLGAPHEVRCILLDRGRRTSY